MAADSPRARGGGPAATSYSIVIATRNRPEALALSLPLMIGQSRPPAEVIVVDGSDDPTPARDLLSRLAGGMPHRHVPAPPGAAAQRNAGLSMATGDVVMMPDDDSLLHPGAAAAIMAIYDRDVEGVIGGVGGWEASEPPPGALEGHDYAMTASDRLKARIARRRYALQDRLAPDPLALRAARLVSTQPPPPPWLDAAGAVPVPWFTGFRMSFRRAVLAPHGFEEALGRYALLEDVDAGLSVQRTHRLVVARAAGIYHHKAPGNRVGGFAMGVMQVLNRAYVTARHGPLDDGLRSAIRRHARSKMVQYLPGTGSAFGRDRLAGARAADRLVPDLLDGSAETLRDRYLDLRARCLPDGD